METTNRAWWRFFDGSVSVSASMLVAVLISKCAGCDQLPLISFLKSLTNEDSGVIIVATMLLFPIALVFFGGLKLYFAAKEAYEIRKRARLRKEREEMEQAKAQGRKQGREQGRAEGRRQGRAEGHAEGRAEGRAEGHAEGRKQVRIELEKRGLLTPELAEIFEEETED